MTQRAKRAQNQPQQQQQQPLPFVRNGADLLYFKALLYQKRERAQKSQPDDLKILSHPHLQIDQVGLPTEGTKPFVAYRICQKTIDRSRRNSQKGVHRKAWPGLKLDQVILMMFMSRLPARTHPSKALEAIQVLKFKAPRAVQVLELCPHFTLTIS